MEEKNSSHEDVKERKSRMLSRSCGNDVDSDEDTMNDRMTQTVPESFETHMERFEDEIQLITSMKERLHADALNLVKAILAKYSLPTEEKFKYHVLKLECYLQQLMFIEAREDGPQLCDMAADDMQLNEMEVANIAYKCRENRNYVRAMIHYQCSLRCWLRDMRLGKIKKRSIQVINRAEKFALVVLHLGLSSDTKGIVYEYALHVFHSFIKDYETGPEQLSAHRDLAIMGCCYYMGATLKSLNDPEGSLNFTSHSINIGMKTMKEHKNHLLAKSHLLAAQCYLAIDKPDDARMWCEVALKLCPFLTNWDYQSTTETRREFEDDVKNLLRQIKSVEVERAQNMK